MENHMILHTNNELFSEVIIQTAQMMGLPEIYIEKDYWVTYVLKRLSQSEYKNRAIFKGGTSLSKAYKLIERFSEDVDLAVVTNGESTNQVKQLIKKIEKTILDENFDEVEDVLTSKGSSFRKTVHCYPMTHEGDFGHAKEHIVIELNSFAKPHPYRVQEISTYMNDFLELHAPELITEYKLESFEVNVLDYRRTFCEKISAVARATFEPDENFTELKSKIRHLYDLYYLLQEESIQEFLLSEDFIKIMHDVRNDDIEQFQGEWAQKPLAEALIFSDTQKCIDAVYLYYQDTFRDLVYSKDVPSLFLIMSSIENVYTIIKKTSDRKL
jgi:predicted nucleotidyltransferase component of viral defense system